MTKAVTPSINKPVGLHSVRQNEPFEFCIADAFLPQDHSLEFLLDTTAPAWLKITPKSGVIVGDTPKVKTEHSYEISVSATNLAGSVSQSFTLQVICSDVVETMAHRPELIHSLNKEKYGFSHLHPYTPSLLEYIYYLYQLPEFREQFDKALQQQALQHHIKVAAKHFNYAAFHDLVKQLCPDIEAILQEHLTQDNILLHERMSNEELRNLFRQGSQQQGVIPIPVWNHFGIPDLYNWPNENVLNNVLDSAADAVSQLKEQADKKENLQRRLELKLKPKNVP